MSLSRRDFLARSSVALAAGTFAQTAIARAWQQQQATPPPAGGQQAPTWTPQFTELRRNTGYYMGRGGTIGYLIDKGAVVAVDSQFADSAKACVDGLQQRSNNRGVDLLINTHHHGDHVSGNPVFKPVTKRILAHARAVELHKEVAARPTKPGAPPVEHVFADRTFTDLWREQLGDEWVRTKFYGRAHTSGDAVITFERANVAHMGDLMFNRRHPVVDRPAGASMKNWITVLEMASKDHNNDTIYIFGHAGGKFPVTGPRAEVMYFRDYLTALLGFVQNEIKAGKTRDEILKTATPLPKFEDHGPLTAGILGNAYDDVTATS